MLPFKSLGSDGRDDLTDGLAEEITSKLTALDDLQVVSTATAARHARAEIGTQQIGERLGAAHVVLGTVQWDDRDTANPRVRVTPQLIRVADDIQIWSESFDRSATEPLEVQSEIAGAVARQVGMSVLGWEGEDVLQALLDDQAVALPVPEIEPAEPTITTRTVSASDSREPGDSATTDAPESTETLVADAGTTEDLSSLAPSTGPVILEVHFTSRVPAGILTLYADDAQILKEQFRYEKKSRLLRAQTHAGRVRCHWQGLSSHPYPEDLPPCRGRIQAHHRPDRVPGRRDAEAEHRAFAQGKGRGPPRVAVRPTIDPQSSFRNACRTPTITV